MSLDFPSMRTPDSTLIQPASNTSCLALRLLASSLLLATQRILHVAQTFLCFPYLRQTFDLSVRVARPFARLALGASRDPVDGALHSLGPYPSVVSSRAKALRAQVLFLRGPFLFSHRCSLKDQFTPLGNLSQL
jgi:hypothetical protein